MPRSEAGDYHLPLEWGPRLFAIGSNTQYLERLSQQAGLKFNFKAQGSNTLDSHRLLLYAEKLDEEEEQKQRTEGGEDGAGGATCSASMRDTLALRLRLAVLT